MTIDNIENQQYTWIKCKIFNLDV